jgi:O-antigen/teichoic acid export membrane protein
MTQSTKRRGRLLAVRVAGQSALLFAGFGIAQIFSFARNAALGYWLSRGDFGIAAALAVTLQLIETMSDIGADRLLVQAREDDQAMLDTAHTIMVARGLVAALVLSLAASPTAHFFGVPQHAGLFHMLAWVPMVRAFINLDQRRRQRDLDNSAYLATEVGSQAIALAVLPFLLWLARSPAVVVWLALIQSLAAVKLSHALSKSPWGLDLDKERLKRFVIFGWPIWLSAFPLIIVYQADRFIVGHTYGMEMLAVYSAAFMVTMVPGLVAAKVGHALMLPLLSEKRSEPAAFAERFRFMCEMTVMMAAVYLALFLFAGGYVMGIAFGPNYRGLDALVAWLAVMWSVRMVQAPPGMALMAVGDNRPLLWAGLIRASALPLAVAAALLGWGVVGIAAAGVVGEIASLIYVSRALGKVSQDLTGATLGRAVVLLPLGAAALFVATQLPRGSVPLSTIQQAFAAGGIMMILTAFILPKLRHAVQGRFVRRRPTFAP